MKVKKSSKVQNPSNTPFSLWTCAVNWRSWMLLVFVGACSGLALGSLFPEDNLQANGTVKSLKLPTGFKRWEVESRRERREPETLHHSSFWQLTEWLHVVAAELNIPSSATYHSLDSSLIIPGKCRCEEQPSQVLKDCYLNWVLSVTQSLLVFLQRKTFNSFS